jgi:hypothetical protein
MSELLEEINDVKKIIQLLENASEISEYSISASEYYAKLFGIEKQFDEVKLIEIKFEMLSLLDKAIKNMLKMDGKNEKSIALLKNTQVLLAAIHIKDDSSQIHNFKAKCKELSGKLELVEERYGGSYNQNILSDEKLTEISKQIDDLVKEIQTTEIDMSFKAILTDELLNMQYSIKKYKIYGSDSIQDATYLFLGKVLLNINKTENATETEKTIFKKIISFITNVNHVIKFGENVAMIASVSSPALLTLLDKLV